ncbi:hypothetical protein [Spiroplasma ixodetis]|uniref:hypothetical protein n=1 Tax=Spiroplasma ixodetis TaxID=2141 RepID=UPI002578C961|nr:hypothetical protein [Spiroplasma ixodetis]
MIIIEKLEEKIKETDKYIKNREELINNRASPHMYLWRKQWNWMSSTMLFKQNRIV